MVESRYKNSFRTFLLVAVLGVLIGVNIPLVSARSGCCSWHGGVSRCDTSVGRYVCNDGTYSPTCGCERIPSSPSPTSALPTTAQVIKSRVVEAKSAYLKNPHWFREELIEQLTQKFGQNKLIGFYVYTLLPDIK